MPQRTFQEFKDGVLIRSGTYEISQESVNADSVREKMEGAIDTLTDAVRNWATLTAAQRTAASRLCIVVVIRLVRFVLNRYDSAGED